MTGTDWTATTLGDVVKRIEAGRSFGAAARPAEANEWGIIRTSAMTYGEFREAENKAVTDPEKVDPRFEIRPGDLLLSRANTQEYVGATVLVGSCRRRLLLSDKSLRLVPREGIDQHWLRYTLAAPDSRQYLSNASTGVKAGMRNVSQDILRALPLRVPPLDEQRRIVEVLEDHLSRIEHASRSLEDAEQRAASLSASSASRLISAGAGRAWTETRFGGATVAIPAHWRMSTIGDEAVLVQYGSGAKTGPARDADDVPVLRMGNVKRGRVQLDSLKYLPRDHPDLERLLLHPGDVLFNRTNSAEHVGKSAVFKGAAATTSFASYLIRVRLNSDVDPNWANLVINSSCGRAFVSSVVSQQVGQANVNGTKLKAFPLPVPPRTEQERLVAQHDEAVEAGSRVAGFARDNLQRALALRRSLLDAAFSGRL